jgi:hypothetical protein
MKRKISIFPLLLAMIGLAGCSQPGMEYSIDHKKVSIKADYIYVDGFLQKDVPVYRGNAEDPNDPNDRIAIAIDNGFGREFRFVFIDKSSEYGFRVLEQNYTMKNVGDTQYAYFDMEGTPTVEGSVPVSFDMLDESGNSVFGTITKPIRVWSSADARPERDMIPTASVPFVFVKAELNFVNQYHEQTPVYLYDNKALPTTNFKPGDGITYNTSVNIRYNSIISNPGAIRPEVTASPVGTTGSQNLLTGLYPTADMLAEHPQWFTCSDGTTSVEWDPALDGFMHGANSKPVAVSMYNPNAPLVRSGNNASVPFSSLTWNVNNKTATTPGGSYFSKVGKYKFYIKYYNNDPASDFIQYFPAHPGTGERGWVSYEVDVKPNPTPGFALDPLLDAADWQPTQEQPVKAIRADLVNKSTGLPVTMKANTALGAGNNVFVRIWFVTLRPQGADSPVGYNFKANQSAGWNSGFNTADVVALAGTGSNFGAGTASKVTNENVHYFLDDALNGQYFISYVLFNSNNNCKIANEGVYKLTFSALAGTGAANPRVPYDMSCPMRVTADATGNNL